MSFYRDRRVETRSEQFGLLNLLDSVEVVSPGTGIGRLPAPGGVADGARPPPPRRPQQHGDGGANRRSGPWTTYQDSCTYVYVKKDPRGGRVFLCVRVCLCERGCVSCECTCVIQQDQKKKSKLVRAHYLLGRGTRSDASERPVVCLLCQRIDSATQRNNLSCVHIVGAKFISWVDIQGGICPNVPSITLMSHPTKQVVPSGAATPSWAWIISWQHGMQRRAPRKLGPVMRLSCYRSSNFDTIFPSLQDC